MPPFNKNITTRNTRSIIRSKRNNNRSSLKVKRLRMPLIRRISLIINLLRRKLRRRVPLLLKKPQQRRQRSLLPKISKKTIPLHSLLRLRNWKKISHQSLSTKTRSKKQHKLSKQKKIKRKSPRRRPKSLNSRPTSQ